MEKRIIYLQRLRNIIKEKGSQSIAYIDESGFEMSAHRPYGWGKVGQKVFGEQNGNKRPRTSLIAGRIGEKFIAPILYEGSTNAIWFNEWVKKYLFKELPKEATVVMDNARFHKTKKTYEIFEKSDFNLLFLPPYSPDFNPIEQDFGIIKKKRIYSNQSLDNIIKMYRNYLE